MSRLYLHCLLSGQIEQELADLSAMNESLCVDNKLLSCEKETITNNISALQNELKQTVAELCDVKDQCWSEKAQAVSLAQELSKKVTQCSQQKRELAELKEYLSQVAQELLHKNNQLCEKESLYIGIESFSSQFTLKDCQKEEALVSQCDVFMDSMCNFNPNVFSLYFCI